jgi:hypothetical protein
MKSVLRNFLGTYTSRYSQFRGYWLFGFLVGELSELNFNLLSAPPVDVETPRAVAEKLAATKFEDQLRKSGLERSMVREARLSLRRAPEVANGSVNGHACAGYNLSFEAHAVMDTDKQYGCKQVLFVAPHDARVERRSGRSEPH